MDFRMDIHWDRCNAHEKYEEGYSTEQECQQELREIQEREDFYYSNEDGF